MTYILNTNLTDAYIQSLVQRCGYTDVTAECLDWGMQYVIQDLNGDRTGLPSIAYARDWLVQQYLIQMYS